MHHTGCISILERRPRPHVLISAIGRLHQRFAEGDPVSLDDGCRLRESFRVRNDHTVVVALLIVTQCEDLCYFHGVALRSSGAIVEVGPIDLRRLYDEDLLVVPTSPRVARNLVTELGSRG